MQGERRASADLMRMGPLAVLMATAVLVPAAAAQLTNDDNPFRVAPDCWVFHSKDGDGFYDFPRVLPAGTQSVGIWVTGGATSDASPSCAPGSATTTGESCFASFVIEMTGPGSLNSFTAASGRSAGHTVSLGGKRIDVNVTAGASPVPGGLTTERMGDLSLTMGTSDAVRVSVTSGSCLGMGLAPNLVRGEVMFLPEPGQGVLLGSALLGLGALYRLRTRRRLASGR